MVGAGCVDEYVGSWVGTSLISQGHNIRNAVENGVPHHLEMRDVSNFGSSLMPAGRWTFPSCRRGRCSARTSRTQRRPRGDRGSVRLRRSARARPAARPDVAIIHVQRCDPLGNAQIRGTSSTTTSRLAPQRRRSSPARSSSRPTRSGRPGTHPHPVLHGRRGRRSTVRLSPVALLRPLLRRPPFYREYGLRSQDREDFLEWLEEDLPARGVHRADRRRSACDARANGGRDQHAGSGGDRTPPADAANAEETHE